jgi:microcystin-dependent protein
VPSQIGIQNCAASSTDGFPPLTFLPSNAGGCPPFGQDMNGILNQLALAVQWMFAGGTLAYDATFQTSIGGYPQDALVQSNILHGRVWRSTVDNNMTNPDDQTGAVISWVVQTGTNPAGTLIPSMTTSNPNLSAVAANGGTVGNASSNGTLRANVDTYWLFVYLWTNCANCAIFTSAGGGSTRGATAAADWAANKAMATPDMRGTGTIGADAGGTTRLSSAPIISGSTTTGASLLGENTHLLSVTEMPSHSHTNSASGSFSDSGHAHGYTAQNGAVYNYYNGGFQGYVPQGFTSNTGYAVIGGSVTVTVNATGGGATHNIVNRDLTVFWYLQL